MNEDEQKKSPEEENRFAGTGLPNLPKFLHLIADGDKEGAKKLLKKHWAELREAKAKREA